MKLSPLNWYKGTFVGREKVTFAKFFKNSDDGVDETVYFAIHMAGSQPKIIIVCPHKLDHYKILTCELASFVLKDEVQEVPFYIQDDINDAVDNLLRRATL